MVLKDKTDEQLIKEINKLWDKRTGDIGKIGFFTMIFSWLWFSCLIYYFNSLFTPIIIMIIYWLFMFVFSTQKKKYYNQPHIYEKNTRELWEYKRELERRRYEIKVIRKTQITNGMKRIYDNLKIVKKEM